MSINDQVASFSTDYTHLRQLHFANDILYEQELSAFFNKHAKNFLYAKTNELLWLKTRLFDLKKGVDCPLVQKLDQILPVFFPHLPSDVQVEIMSYLPRSDVFAIYSSSKKGMGLVRTNIKTILKNPVKDWGKEFISKIQFFKLLTIAGESLMQLNVPCSQPTRTSAIGPFEYNEWELAAIHHACPNIAKITGLFLSFRLSKHRYFKVLNSFTSLKSLDVSFSKILPQVEADKLSLLTALTHLKACGERVTDEFVQIMARNLTNLESLDLAGNKGITGILGEREQVVGGTKMKILDFLALKKLKSLNISNTNVFSIVIQWSVAKITTLNELNISRCNKLYPGCLESLGELSSLQLLDISRNFARRNIVPKLLKLKKLNTLVAIPLREEGYAFNEMDFCALQRLKDLKKVIISKTHFADRLNIDIEDCQNLFNHKIRSIQKDLHFQIVAV